MHHRRQTSSRIDCLCSNIGGLKYSSGRFDKPEIGWLASVMITLCSGSVASKSSALQHEIVGTTAVHSIRRILGQVAYIKL